MPKILDFETDTIIRTLSKENFSPRLIRAKLLEGDIDVSVQTICNVLNSIGIRRNATKEGLPIPKFRRPPVKRTNDMVRKVKNWIESPNPPTFTRMQSLTSLSRDTLSKIVHTDLKLQTVKKCKVHRLNQAQKKNRKKNCRKLYEKNRAGDKSEYAVTLDEAMVYIDDCNGERRICYVQPNETVPETWVFEKTENFKTGFMVVGVISGRGCLPLYRVPNKVKINARYYVDFVLKPLFREYLPRLYPNEMNKIFFHHDKATAHTASLTIDILSN